MGGGAPKISLRMGGDNINNTGTHQKSCYQIAVSFSKLWNILWIDNLVDESQLLETECSLIDWSNWVFGSFAFAWVFKQVTNLFLHIQNVKRKGWHQTLRLSYSRAAPLRSVLSNPQCFFIFPDSLELVSSLAFCKPHLGIETVTVVKPLVHSERLRTPRIDLSKRPPGIRIHFRRPRQANARSTVLSPQYLIFHWGIPGAFASCSFQSLELFYSVDICFWLSPANRNKHFEGDSNVRTIPWSCGIRGFGCSLC